MFNESPRKAKLIAGTLTVLAMGFGGVASALPGDHGNRPGVGEVGNANPNPAGHDIVNGDDNNGFRCDEGNYGAGAGNPALGSCDGDSYSPGSGPTSNGGGNNGIGNGPGGDSDVTPGT